MTKRTNLPEQDIERWLAGPAPPEGPPASASALDAASAAGPQPATWRKARQRLQDRLIASAPRVYYDRGKSSLVGPLWVAVTDHGLAAGACGGGGNRVCRGGGRGGGL